MDQLHGAFRKAIRKQLAYQANWQPTRHLVLGTILSLSNGELVIVSTLQEKGVAIETTIVDAESVVFTFGQGTEYSIKTSGQGTVEGASLKGRIELKFGSKNGGFVSAAGCCTETIANREAVFRAVKSLAANKAWDPQWIFVDEAFRAKKLNVLISQSEQAELELEADGKTNLPINLGEASLTLAATHSKGSVFQCLGATNAVPCFKGMVLSKRWYELGGEPRVRRYNLGNDDPTEEDDQVSSDFEEFVFG